MFLIDVLKQYVMASGSDPASKSRDAIRYAALGVTAGYAVAFTYRAGGLKYLMPAPVYGKLVSLVKRAKEGTQPLVDKEKFTACSTHLIRTYSLLTAGCVLSAVGTRAFFALPDLPIGVPIAVSATSAAVLVFARPWMTPVGKLAAYSAMCLATGVSFGPLNWVAYDSVIPFAVVVSSTAAGFCAPLYITRGIVSYFCSAQLLSCSLSVVGAGMLVSATKVTGVTPATTRQRMEKDISSMVTAQIVTNMALGAFHTIPTIYRFMKLTPQELATEDPIYQASLIYGAASYSLWTFFRIVCNSAFRSLKKDKKKQGVKVSEEVASAFGNVKKEDTLFTLRNMSNLSASLMFLFTYVRVVTYMQSHREGSSRALDFARKLFSYFSPV